MKRSAALSRCGTYRYRLDREWDQDGGRVAFIMLNPSTADANIDDPTIRRCIAFAKSWGYGGLVVGNLWAYRATDPKDLKRVLKEWDGGVKARGPENYYYLQEMCAQASRVVCAWGPNGAIDGRSDQVRNLLFAWHVMPHYLRLTKDGHPGHPLYLPGSLTPQPWTA